MKQNTQLFGPEGVDKYPIYQYDGKTGLTRLVVRTSWVSLFLVVVLGLWGAIGIKVAQDATLRQIDSITGSLGSFSRIPKGRVGIASYYDYKLPSGWSSKGHRVAASRFYKRGTRLLVTNLANGAQIEVVVTDYGPDESIYPERVIDLSSYAFSFLTNPAYGLARVRVEEL